ncbi:hypothetical protein BV25DRAFT_1831407 [Artomyces pyxidatus]|uniref:Uncharacterized protein n=1 Tax=Artomyces pyxidatus TaxID=48021 RepID=A0ACB8SL01_9AGAM|nr:hypothetical protein BV25DRAFT_1831407 [Artomyces pyxidatus]
MGAESLISFRKLHIKDGAELMYQWADVDCSQDRIEVALAPTPLDALLRRPEFISSDFLREAVKPLEGWIPVARPVIHPEIRLALFCLDVELGIERWTSRPRPSNTEEQQAERPEGAKIPRLRIASTGQTCSHCLTWLRRMSLSYRCIWEIAPSRYGKTDCDWGRYVDSSRTGMIDGSLYIACLHVIDEYLCRQPELTRWLPSCMGFGW